MSDTIKPALTPEEWAAKRFWLDGENFGTQVSLSGEGAVVIRDDDYYTGFTKYADRRHALAALALHGQPVGFCRADVGTLRRLALSATKMTRDEFVALDSLAARIEALLPPLDAPTPQA